MGFLVVQWWFSAGDMGSVPGQGRSHAQEHLSPGATALSLKATTTESCALQRVAPTGHN